MDAKKLTDLIRERRAKEIVSFVRAVVYGFGDTGFIRLDFSKKRPTEDVLKRCADAPLTPYERGINNFVDRVLGERNTVAFAVDYEGIYEHLQKTGFFSQGTYFDLYERGDRKYMVLGIPKSKEKTRTTPVLFEDERELKEFLSDVEGH